MINLGALVRVKKREKIFADKIGVVLDAYEDANGFYMYEMLIDGEIEWFSDLALEVVSSEL